MGQDPEGLGLHVAAVAPSIAHIRVIVGALDSLIDGGAAVYQTFSNWDSTATTHRGRHAPPTAQQVNINMAAEGWGVRELSGNVANLMFLLAGQQTVGVATGEGNSAARVNVYI